jgi:uncharacterized protein with NRDE domain
MCLILFAWRAHPDFELVLAANRDEFHNRAAAPADFWPDQPDVLAGRDLEAGGTWLGVTRGGRFAAITNYRERIRPVGSARRSRGLLVNAWLSGAAGALPMARSMVSSGRNYNGFSLLLGQAGELVYLSNRAAEPQRVDPGVHGLSNHLLDTDWPKVSTGRERLAGLLEQGPDDPEALFGLLRDDSPVGGPLPAGEAARLAPESLARQLFVRSPIYGTRCSTVLLVGHDGQVRFEERRFDARGRPDGSSSFRFASRRAGQS